MEKLRLTFDNDILNNGEKRTQWESSRNGRENHVTMKKIMCSIKYHTQHWNPVTSFRKPHSMMKNNYAKMTNQVEELAYNGYAILNISSYMKGLITRSNLFLSNTIQSSL